MVARPALRFSRVAPCGLELTSLFRSPGPGSPPPLRLGVVSRFHPLRHLVSRRPRCSQVPCALFWPLPCSQTPAGPWRQTLCGARVWSPQLQRRGRQLLGFFRGSITRLQPSRLTLRAAFRATTQNSLPAAGQPFRVGFPMPTEFVWRVSRFLRSPLPGLFLARWSSSFSLFPASARERKLKLELQTFSRARPKRATSSTIYACAFL